MGTTAEELKAAGAALAKSIIDTTEARAKKFLDDNAGSRGFVADRAERFGVLGVDYLAAPDDATRAHILEQIEVVQQSIENEISTVAVNASVASREQFQAILGSIIDTAKSVLPIVLGFIKR